MIVIVVSVTAFISIRTVMFIISIILLEYSRKSPVLGIQVPPPPLKHPDSRTAVKIATAKNVSVFPFLMIVPPPLFTTLF